MMLAATTGERHALAVDNPGETHDYAAEWVDAKTTKGHYAWSQEGKAMEETIGFKLTSARTIGLRGAVSANAGGVGSFNERHKR